MQLTVGGTQLVILKDLGNQLAVQKINAHGQHSKLISFINKIDLQNKFDAVRGAKVKKIDSNGGMVWRVF